jgi:hypothetical protein
MHTGLTDIALYAVIIKSLNFKRKSPEGHPAIETFSLETL